MEISARGIVCKVEDTHPPIDSKIVEVCKEWLTLWGERRSTINREFSSYVLKHAVESWAGTYISNGAFIVAAQHLGYTLDQVRPGSPNAFFNLGMTRWNQHLRRHHQRDDFECHSRCHPHEDAAS